jgi:hypothetical protein
MSGDFNEKSFGSQGEAKSKTSSQKSGFEVWTSGKPINVWNQPRKSEGNQVHTYMHAGIKFHAYSDIKVYTETVSRKKKRLSEIYA